jgi:hypothetical protein
MLGRTSKHHDCDERQYAEVTREIPSGTWP